MSVCKSVAGIKQELKKLFIEQLQLDRDDLSDELLLMELDMDSLELLEFIVAAEQLFRVELDEAALARCLSVGEAAELIINSIRMQRGESQ